MVKHLSILTEIQSITLYLFLVLTVFIIGVAFFIKINNLSNKNKKNILILASQQLGSKEKVVLLSIFNKKILVGVTSHMINRICDIENVLDDQLSKNFSNKHHKDFDAELDDIKNELNEQRTKNGFL